MQFQIVLGERVGVHVDFTELECMEGVLLSFGSLLNLVVLGLIIDTRVLGSNVETVELRALLIIKVS